ncbi:MAG: hypothetical protein EI684_21665 [Candidatus Viridilinea halotolerans]|uniref:Uncharacterized protein n=1 Tax=Candidatus Viridilinea halotolerans TaxID=2491704 RepID=A0A426TRA8_9CHLR|nr:MAG: hypothetical protein EI684_21665 [Candidatus Viridilinea halotolerans]
MQWINYIHALFGRDILSVLIIGLAIYLTVRYRNESFPRNGFTRAFPVLVDIQVALGIIYWIFLLFVSPISTVYLGFPFILHPVLGLLAAGLAHMAVSPRMPLRQMGRWAPMASLGVMLVLVLANAFIPAWALS